MNLILISRKENLNFLEECLYSDYRMFLGENVLKIVDSSSMAHSVESRPPFLSKALINFSIKNISPEHKLYGRSTKYILKN